jgi:predicted phage terminase large subunit-like protein
MLAKTPQEEEIALLKTLQDRRKARNHLIDFTKYTFPNYNVGPQHPLIAGALEDVVAGKCDRLIINMPPRHGKSELASRRFPAWFMGMFPDHEIIAASYNSELATDFGREVRNIIDSPEYRALFPGTELASDSKSKNRWNTSAGGGYVAAGVGSATTGRGAHVFLIDDPIKDYKDAESEGNRDDVWDWYRSVAYTRLAPGGAIVLIQTRWHEDDLGGRIVEAEKLGGDQWRKLILPAIDTDGQPLWPDRYPLESLERTRDNVGVRVWESLYQQNPTPDTGTYFQREWFQRRSDEVPEGSHIYICSDYAVSEGKGDFTEHGVFAFAPNGDIYVVDWWYGQTAADKWVESLLDLCVKHKPVCVFGEGGVIAKSVEPLLKRRMTERQVYFRLEWVNSTKDKPTRARAIQARAASGKVVLCSGHLGDRLLEQCISFPAGKHDDAVDVLGTMGRVIDEAHPGVSPAGGGVRNKPKDRWEAAFDRAEENRAWLTV